MAQGRAMREPGTQCLVRRSLVRACTGQGESGNSRDGISRQYKKRSGQKAAQLGGSNVSHRATHLLGAVSSSDGDQIQVLELSSSSRVLGRVTFRVMGLPLRMMSILMLSPGP